MRHAQAKSFSPALGAFLSLLIPGLGQMYEGRGFVGLFWFVVTLVAYAHLIPAGVCLHLACVISAGMAKPKAFGRRQKGTPAHSPGVHQFYSKVVGVTFNNDDGSNRQAIIRKCKEGEQLTLWWDQANQHSSHAVGVFRQNGKQLGHLPDDTAAGVVLEMQAGWNFLAYAQEKTGGDPRHGKRNVGMNLVILRYT